MSATAWLLFAVWVITASLVVLTVRELGESRAQTLELRVRVAKLEQRGESGS